MPVPKAGVDAGVPKGPGVVVLPNAGVLAPKPLPNAVGVEPNAVFPPPKVGVAGWAPNAGVDDAPNTGCSTHTVIALDLHKPCQAISYDGISLTIALGGS